MKTREELTMKELEQISGGWTYWTPAGKSEDGGSKWPYSKEQSAVKGIIVGNHWGPHWGE